MAAQGRGGGVTPSRVVELLKQEVAESSQAATARKTGLTLQTVQRYIKGIGEPSNATLKKLADYFNVGVWQLRETENEKDERIDEEIDELDTFLNLVELYHLASSDRHKKTLCGFIEGSILHDVHVYLTRGDYELEEEFLQEIIKSYNDANEFLCEWYKDYVPLPKL